MFKYDFFPWKSISENQFYFQLPISFPLTSFWDTPFICNQEFQNKHLVLSVSLTFQKKLTMA